MPIDQNARKRIEGRGELGRRAGTSENEKALGKDVKDLLEELDRVSDRRNQLEAKVSELEAEISRLQDAAGDD